MEDGEMAACQYAVLNMGYKPSEFANLPRAEKVFVIACIENKIDAEKKRLAEIKSRPKKRGR